MKRTQHILFYSFWVTIVINLLIACLFEFLTKGTKTMVEGNTLFVILFSSELITICAIPLVLRLFKFGFVHRQLVQQKEIALLKYGMIRICVFSVLMTANTLLYYIYNNAAFGYLSIILFLSMMFIYPSMSRCCSEVEDHA